MPAVSKGGWLFTMATFAHGVPKGQMLRPDWKNSKTFARFNAASDVHYGPAYGPILLLAGGADATTPPKVTDATYERLRAGGADVKYRVYPGLDHDPLVFGSFRDQLRFVEDRFAGKPFVAAE